MSIFKEMAVRYCEKILANYQSQADEKTYIGKEAELLIQRNDFAHCLVRVIKAIEVKENDYNTYFKQILAEINSTLNEARNSVVEYNTEHKTAFTTDLYESLFTFGLISFITSLSDLFQKSPAIITKIEDDSLFTNNRTVPWVYQFSFILYDYILEREFDIAVNKVERDIFDAKKKLIFKYIENVASLSARFKDENDAQYQDQMEVLLSNFRSEEQDIQRRKPDDKNTSNTYYSFFTQTIYKASEKLVGKNQLGQKIDFLIKEFDERTITTELTCG